MSVEAITWGMERRFDSYWERPLRPGEKLLLIVIANSADVHGIAFPGRSFLADRCCCDEATVSRNLRKLEHGGLIVRVHRRRRNGSRTSDWMVLAPTWSADSRQPLRDAPEGPWPALVRQLATATKEEVLDDFDEGLFGPEISSPDEASDNETSDSKPPSDQVAICGGPEPSEEPSDPSLKRRVRARGDAEMRS